MISKEVIDYEIVSEVITSNLQNEIKKKIALGWQPYGNVMMENIPEGPTYFHQPIVKYKDQ